MIMLIIVPSLGGLKKSDGRQQVDKTCVCISGYVQPQPFKEKIYLQLTESDDGFIDRLLLCFPKTRILLEEVCYSILLYYNNSYYQTHTLVHNMNASSKNPIFFTIHHMVFLVFVGYYD